MIVSCLWTPTPYISATIKYRGAVFHKMKLGPKPVLPETVKKKFLDVLFLIFMCLPFRLSFISGYDCGLFVICNTEHLCKQLLQGSSVSLDEAVTQASVTSRRTELRELIIKLSAKWCKILDLHLQLSGWYERTDAFMVQVYDCSSSFMKCCSSTWLTC